MNTTRFLRHLNVRRCLRLLADGRAVSRADMARQLGLTRSTVGNAVNALDQAGYICNSACTLPEGRTGRPGITLSLRSAGAYFIGLNIGLRLLSIVVLDLRGTIIQHKNIAVETCCHEPDRVLEKIRRLCSDLITRLGIKQERIEGAGVAVPGLVDRNGMVINAPFLQWRNYPLRAQLRAHWPAQWQIYVGNDAFAFGYMQTLGQAPVHTQHQHAATLYIVMNEGIGSALFINGQPMLGTHSYAGEIGRMLIAVENRSGTFESLAGAQSFAYLLPSHYTPTQVVAYLLAEKNKTCINKALGFWSQALAVGLANAIHLFDPMRIVLGGPIALLYPEVQTMVMQQLANKLLPGFVVPSIYVADRGEDGAAIGAAASIRQALFALPDLEDKTTLKPANGVGQ